MNFNYTVKDLIQELRKHDENALVLVSNGYGDIGNDILVKGTEEELFTKEYNGFNVPSIFITRDS